MSVYRSRNPDTHTHTSVSSEKKDGGNNYYHERYLRMSNTLDDSQQTLLSTLDFCLFVPALPAEDTLMDGFYGALECVVWVDFCKQCVSSVCHGYYARSTRRRLSDL